MKVKVVKSEPAPAQEGIDHLVGKVYTVISKDKETGAVKVSAPEFGGQISLNRTEYRRIHRKKTT